MKTYLVTGAAGFIGSNFVKYLLKKYGEDIQIIIVDALTYAGNLASIKDEIELDNASFVKSDTADYETIKSVFTNNDIDYVVNSPLKVMWIEVSPILSFSSKPTL